MSAIAWLWLGGFIASVFEGYMIDGPEGWPQWWRMALRSALWPISLVVVVGEDIWERWRRNART